MQIEKEILTYPMTLDQLREELSFLVEYFNSKGVYKCKILFGFAWGIDYYPTRNWEEEEILIKDIPIKIKDVEASGIGNLGHNDLFVEVDGLKFRFCNDCDIHIYFFEHQETIEYFYNRWKELGFNPAEWLKNEKTGPGKRIRIN